MATAILDLDIQGLPTEINVLERYAAALALLRRRGRPLGQARVPVLAGRIAGGALQAAVHASLDQGPDDDPAPVEPSSLPSATIAVCTRDRPDDLRRCLSALQRLPDDGQELVVIDNCPATDATRQVVAEQTGARPVRYIREDAPGLSAARNRALREARHAVVAFTDDDAVPDPGWLRGLLRNFDRPEVLCVTGLTMPLELETEAQEYSERFCPFNRGFRRVVFDRTNLHPMAAGRVGAGVNMAVRRTLCEHVGRFDEALGPGTPSCSGDDTEMYSRILAAGYQIVYDPAALCWHRHRRTWQELRRLVYGYGVGTYAFWTRSLIERRELAAPLHAFGWLIYDQLPGLARSLLRRPGSLPADLRLAELRGCAVGPVAYLAARRRCAGRMDR